jgi:restriction endonuclease BamHI
MKIVHIERLIDEGRISSTLDWHRVEQDILNAIATIEWPPNSGSFTLHPERNGNGVVPIKEACMIYLKSQQWIPEYKLSAIGTGKIDAVRHTNQGYFGFEWETGNISSSHRAMNKMALALLKNVIAGGILVLPSRNMYKYLTDRIGNFSELQPYFPLWQSLNKTINKGILEIIVIEHDAISLDVPRISKGTDGRALL